MKLSVNDPEVIAKLLGLEDEETRLTFTSGVIQKFAAAYLKPVLHDDKWPVEMEKIAKKMRNAIKAEWRVTRKQIFASFESELGNMGIMELDTAKKAVSWKMKEEVKNLIRDSFNGYASEAVRKIAIRLLAKENLEESVSRIFNETIRYYVKNTTEELRATLSSISDRLSGGFDAKRYAPRNEGRYNVIIEEDGFEIATTAEFKDGRWSKPILSWSVMVRCHET